MKCAYVLLFVCCLLPVGFAMPAAPLLNYQDTYGQYSFGYSGPTSARSEVRTLDGVTHGTYSYIDDTGVIQSARYIADDQGFRITATNIPRGPVYLQTSPGLALAQLETRNVDQVDDLGATNVFLKQVRQEAGLTPEGKQQVASAANAASPGSALVGPQTRIGEDSAFLQQAKELPVEKQLGAATVPDGKPETKIGESNVFLQQAKGFSGEKQLGITVVPDVAARKSIAVDSTPKTQIGENNVFLTQVREEQRSVSAGKVAAEGRIAAASVEKSKVERPAVHSSPQQQ